MRSDGFDNTINDYIIATKNFKNLNLYKNYKVHQNIKKLPTTPCK